MHNIEICKSVAHGGTATREGLLEIPAFAPAIVLFSPDLP